MKFEVTATEYLTGLSKLLLEAAESGEATDELSFRGPLETFLRHVYQEISPEAVITLEPKRRSAGAPDFRIHHGTTLGVFGFIEAKGPRLNTQLADEFLNIHQKQIERYRSLGYKLIITDGLQFFLFQPNKDKPTHASLVQKPLTPEALRDALPDPQVFAILAELVSEVGRRIVDERGLIELTAQHARELREVVAELTPLDEEAAVDEAERKTIVRLRAVKRAVQNGLDPHLESLYQFAGFVAQVLAFSLLYAYRTEEKQATDAVDLYDRLSKWGKATEERNESLRPFRELIRLLGDELEQGARGSLGRVYDTLRTILSYMKLPSKAAEEPDYHVLYEQFLDSFDKELREQYGAYYTPNFLAEASVKLTAHLLAVDHSANVRIIEPCCGTGTFIDALQTHMDGRHSLTAIEVLPSAYALAWFRIAHNSTKLNHITNIVLANTLADDVLKNESKPNDNLGLFELEQNDARTGVKPPITLVIGNPPAAEVSTSDPSFCKVILSQMDDFRPPASKRYARSNEQKQTKSTAMQFLRWSVERLIASNNGIISLILPASFVSGGTLRYARRWFRQQCGEVWIIEIDGDARASTQNNLFNVLQGRALVIGKLSRTQRVHYISLLHLSRDEKRKWLELPAWQQLQEMRELKNSSLIDNLAPVGQPNARWESFTPLLVRDSNEGIFCHVCSGVKLAPTHLFVHIRKPLLLRRIRDLTNPQFEYTGYIEKWHSGQSRAPHEAKLSVALRERLASASKLEGVVRDYYFRPFLTVKAVIDDGILSAMAKTKGGGTRYRPELFPIFASADNLAIGLTSCPKDVAKGIGRPACLISAMPDNDLVRRGNVRVLAGRSPGNKKGTGWGGLRSNVRSSLRVYYANAFANLSETPENAVILYIYSILSCDWFLLEFEDQLLNVNVEEFPRIPLPADQELFLKIARIGKLFREAEQQIENGDVWPQDGNFVPFRFESFDIQGSDIILLNAQGKKCWAISNVGEILSFECGGYSVLKTWLKFYSYDYLRADLEWGDICKLERLTRALTFHRDIQEELTPLVVAAADGEQFSIKALSDDFEDSPGIFEEC